MATVLRLAAAVSVLAGFRPAAAQNGNLDATGESIVESVDLDAEEITDVEELTHLLENPLDLNAATVEQLVLIPEITRRAAERIIQHRTKVGRFETVESLTNVPGVSEATMEDVTAFLRISQPSERKRISRVLLVQKLERRLETGRGYRPDPNDSTARYSGGPLASTTRVAVTHGESLNGSVVLNHDAGEPFVWNPQGRRFGPDFVGGSIQYQSTGPIRSFVVGDIRYESLLGLSIGRNSFSSFEQPSRRLSTKPPRPSRSTVDAGRLRGVAVHVAANALTITLVASRRRRDARIDSSATADGRTYRLVAESGLHRTTSELAGRRQLAETLVALRIGLRWSRLSIGVNTHMLSFAGQVVRGSRPDETVDFEGSVQRVATADALLEYRSGRCAAEVSVSLRKQFSGAALCEVDLGSANRAWLYARSFGRATASVYASTLDRNAGSASNEHGVSVGWRSRPFPKLTVTTHADVWWTPWIRYLLFVPSSGYELGLRLTLRQARHAVSARVTTLVRDRGTQTVDRWGRALRGVASTSRTRASLKVDLSPVHAIRARIKSSITAATTGVGRREIGASLQLALRYVAGCCDVRAGIVMFDALSDAVRQYAYEPDLRYGLGNVSMSGAGERWYVLFTITPAPTLSLQVKYSSTIRYGARSVGSGLDEVAGNRLRKIGVQAIFDF